LQGHLFNISSESDSVGIPVDDRDTDTASDHVTQVTTEETGEHIWHGHHPRLLRPSPLRDHVWRIHFSQFKLAHRKLGKGKLAEIGLGVHESPKIHRCSLEFGWVHQSLGKLGQAMEEQHPI
jgi:hypothetical protein